MDIAGYKDLLDHLTNAKEYTSKHKYSRAKKEYEAALEIESDNQEAKEGLKDAEEKVGKIHELKEKTEEVRKSGEYEQELESLRELIELIPGDIELRTRLEEIPVVIKKRDLKEGAASARKTFNFEEEEKYLKQLLELTPAAEEITGRLPVIKRFLEHLRRAERCISEYQYQQAVEEYELALEIEGNHSQACKGLQKAKSLLIRITDLKGRTSTARAEENYEEEIMLLNELAALEERNNEVAVRIAKLSKLIIQHKVIKRLVDLEKGCFEWRGCEYPREAKDKKSGIEMVLIEPGEFEMGSNMGYEEERPVHRVRITSPFYLGKYQVTQKQYKDVMGDNPSHFTATDNLPVEQVTWHAAKKFCKKLGEGFRFPTEAEWVYACRAGTETKYFWGNQIDGDYCWSNKNSKMAGIFSVRRTHPIGEKKPNSWGLYDMIGNVWEWCEDWYVNSYKDTPKDGSANRNGEKKYKVLRGGSWDNYPGPLRSAFRIRCTPTVTDSSYGFRISWTP